MSTTQIKLSDFSSRLTSKRMLATTALYGPWLPDGAFDMASYERLVRDVMAHDSLPATNVDTTWAQYNTWDVAKRIILATARVALEFSDAFPEDRPLLVVGLNTNSEDLTTPEIPRSIARKVKELTRVFSRLGMSRVRYMPVPDRRLLGAPRATKVAVYREIGEVVGAATDYGLVFFELDIGIPNFGSDFDLDDIAEILAGTPQIQEYKSAVIAPKSGKRPYRYDYSDDLARIMVVEDVAPDRVQFSTGNDWCISLARCGARLPRFGYLLGASQMSPELFRTWRNLVEADAPAAIALGQDLQGAARDFWTPGNVGVYRHYIAILLALAGKIAHPLPHPDVDARFRVRPEDYWLPLKHALRLGLVPKSQAVERALAVIPGAADMRKADLKSRIRLLG